METKVIIKELLEKKFSVHIEEDQYDVCFFEKNIGLVARNVVDLIFELEQLLGCEVSKDSLLDNKVCTFNGLTHAFESIE